jgi:hypothetical protein
VQQPNYRASFSRVLMIIHVEREIAGRRLRIVDRVDLQLQL